jgi:hypothetical protein
MHLKNQRASARQSAGVCAFHPIQVFPSGISMAPIPGKKMALE